MCTEPALLCLDEPAAGLNARESAALSELLLAIRAEHGTSILLIEHDMSVVMEISDHIVVLDHGVKIAEGTPRADPRRSQGDRRLSRRRRRRGHRGDGGRDVSAAAPLLAIRGLRAAYGKIDALKGVDLDVKRGEIVALIGANGAGKSTLMMSIFGRPRARAGAILYRRPRHHRRADPRDRAAAHRAIAGRPPHFPAHERGGKPADGRRRRPRARDGRATPSLERVLHAVSAPQGAHRPSAAARCPAASSRCWRSAAR